MASSAPDAASSASMMPPAVAPPLASPACPPLQGIPFADPCEDAAEDPRRFDFSFAFNNADFADREIHLRICPDPESSCAEAGGSACALGCAELHAPAREPSAAAPGVFLQGDACSGSPDQAGSMPLALSTTRPLLLPGTHPMLAASSPAKLCTSGPGAGAGAGVGVGAASPGQGKALSPPGHVDAAAGVQVRVVSLHLSSVVLAAKSSFFRTLFTCGLKEACNNSKPVELNVSPEEEGPLIDLLRFIYTGDMVGSPSSSEPEDIIKMYLVADKFGVTSCMKICLERLASLPMTVPTACLYLSLPDSMHSNRGVVQLLDSSRSFLVSHFRDLERVHKSEEFLALPLVGVQTLLASDELNVRDELTAFHAMTGWLQHHHEDLEERRRAAVRLAENVRFPLMTGDDLEEVVLKAPEMESSECQALVREAAWFRAYSLVRRLRLMNETAAVHRRFWQRQWNRHSVGHVYFDIHLERFQTLAISSTVESAAFGIGGKRFYLSARHGRRDDGTETLDIHLHLENSHSVQPEIQVSFIFYAKRWPEGQFDYLRDRVTKGFGRNASNWGYSNILGRPWSEVVQDNSKYFHNGVMSVFAEVQILELHGQDKADKPSPSVGSQI